MGPVGVPEMIVIFLVALVLFGPKKLPELGRLLGKGLSEFRRAKNELKSTFESHLSELERETRLQDTGFSSKTGYSPARYSYPYEEYKYESNNLSSSEQQTFSANGSVTPQSEPQIDPAVPNAPVANTVPRNNGVRPIESASVDHEEDHPA